MKIKSVGRNVVLYAPDNLVIAGQFYHNKNEHRFGKLIEDATAYDETGREYQFKAGTWFMVGAARKIQVGNDYYLGVEVDEILGTVEEEVKEEISFKK